MTVSSRHSTNTFSFFFMKKFTWTLLILVVGSLGWYLGSPLLIDTVVDEGFPVVESPKEGMMEEMDMEEMMEKMETLTVEDVDAMPPEEQEEMKAMMEKMSKEMPDTVMEDPTPSSPQKPTIALQGQFSDADSFHKGSGSATIYTHEDGSNLLRFEDFSVTNGPALSVFLTKNADGSLDGGSVNVGKLKGNKGSQNYTLPADIDHTQYKAVLIYCVPFKVPFAQATLR
jgi:hypothetical protein